MNQEFKKAFYRIQKFKTNQEQKSDYFKDRERVKMVQDEEQILQTKLMQNSVIYSGEKVGNKIRLMSPPLRKIEEK